MSTDAPTPAQLAQTAAAKSARDALPANPPILKYFAYAHLPEPLREVSALLSSAACILNEKLPDGAEKSAGLRKLLEAKDCFVRAALP